MSHRNSTVVLRDVTFEFDPDDDPVWNRAAPEFVAAANGVSLMMPYIEPYFAASIRKAILDLADPARLNDPALAITAEAFVRQELQHQREHRTFNRLVRNRFPRLSKVEARMRRTYTWLGRTAGTRFNLAFAASSETIAYSLARWTSDHLAEFLRGGDRAATDLFLWHLAEEVEHKSVAFDVWEAVDGSRLRYARAGLCSLLLLGCFNLSATFGMLRAERLLRYPWTWWRLGRLFLSFSFEVVPTLFVSSLPGHHPSQFTDPDWYAAWLSDFERRRNPGAAHTAA